MSTLVICRGDRMAQIVRTRSIQWLVSITVAAELPSTPSSMPAEQHLRLACHDVFAPDTGVIAPHINHVKALHTFAKRWDLQGDLLVHCSAGVSRSMAGALIIACAVKPDDIHEWPNRLRIAAPHAEPNRLLIAHADDYYGLKGRLMDSVTAMGNGLIVDLAPTTELPLR